jgi:hypothetical protein
MKFIFFEPHEDYRTEKARHIILGFGEEKGIDLKLYDIGEEGSLSRSHKACCVWKNFLKGIFDTNDDILFVSFLPYEQFEEFIKGLTRLLGMGGYYLIHKFFKIAKLSFIYFPEKYLEKVDQVVYKEISEMTIQNENGENSEDLKVHIAKVKVALLSLISGKVIVDKNITVIMDSLGYRVSTLLKGDLIRYDSNELRKTLKKDKIRNCEEGKLTCKFEVGGSYGKNKCFGSQTGRRIFSRETITTLKWLFNETHRP